MTDMGDTISTHMLRRQFMSAGRRLGELPVDNEFGGWHERFYEAQNVTWVTGSEREDRIRITKRLISAALSEGRQIVVLDPLDVLGPALEPFDAWLLGHARTVVETMICSEQIRGLGHIEKSLTVISVREGERELGLRESVEAIGARHRFWGGAIQLEELARQGKFRLIEQIEFNVKNRCNDPSNDVVILALRDWPDEYRHMKRRSREFQNFFWVPENEVIDALIASIPTSPQTCAALIKFPWSNGVTFEFPECTSVIIDALDPAAEAELWSDLGFIKLAHQWELTGLTSMEENAAVL
jgi:hypothetical protein